MFGLYVSKAVYQELSFPWLGVSRMGALQSVLDFWKTKEFFRPFQNYVLLENYFILVSKKI